VRSRSRFQTTPRGKFFADRRYLEVRTEHFEPAVARVFVLAEVGGGGGKTRSD